MLVERIFDTKIYNYYKNKIPADSTKKHTSRNTVSKEYKQFEIMRQRLSHINSNLQRARNRKDQQKFSISLDEIWKIGERQKWKCALTGIPLEFTRGGSIWRGRVCNRRSCSLDRIDSTRGYVSGNIQLVTWEVNCIKTNMENQEFIKLCKQVSRTHK